MMVMNYRAARLTKRQRAMLDFAVKLTVEPWDGRGGRPRAAAPRRLLRPRHLGHRVGRGLLQHDQPARLGDRHAAEQRSITGRRDSPMHSPTTNAPSTAARVVLLDDTTTPQDFVVGLLISVFGKAEGEARGLVDRIGQTGRIECGPYPGAVAAALLRAAVDAAAAAGHPLKIEREELPETARACAFCGQPGSNSKRFFKGRQDFICEDCVRSKARHLDEQAGGRQFRYIYEALNWHFAGLTKDQIVTSTRTFPGTMRADLQKAIERLLAEDGIRLYGVQRQYRFEPLSFAELLDDNDRPRAIAPLQTDEVDTGDDELVKCLDNAVGFAATKV